MLPTLKFNDVQYITKSTEFKQAYIAYTGAVKWENQSVGKVWSYMMIDD